MSSCNLTVHTLKNIVIIEKLPFRILLTLESKRATSFSLPCKVLLKEMIYRKIRQKMKA